jgi:hypothetical protein
MTRSATLPAILGCLLLAACGSSAGPRATPGPSGQSEMTVSPATRSPTVSTGTYDAGTRVRLVWSHVGKSDDEPQVWYVARATNPGASPPA